MNKYPTLTEQECAILLSAKASQLKRVVEARGKDWKVMAGVIIDEMGDLTVRLSHT